jgi:hypothetical protein
MLRRLAPPTGYEKPQPGLRPLCGFSPPHFARRWNRLRGFFIAAVKTSYTAGTLSVMSYQLPVFG